MQRTIFGLIAITGVCLVTADALAKVPHKRDCPLFESKAKVFSMRIPPSWDVDETHDGANYSMTAAPSTDGGGPLQFTVKRVLTDDPPYDRKKPDSAATSMAAEIARGMSHGSTVIATPKATYRGVRTHEFSILTHLDADCQWSYLVIAIRKRGWIALRWDTPCRADITPKDQAEFDIMRDSLMISPNLGAR